MRCSSENAARTWIVLQRSRAPVSFGASVFSPAQRSRPRCGSARNAIAGQGLTVLDIGPDAAPAFFQSELAKHQKLVRQSGATLD